MLQKNPELMQEILEFTDRFYARHGRSPSCRDIATGTTMKKSSVHNYLVAMDEKGMIEYNGQTILTPSIRAQQNGIRQVGIIGSVSCGIPTDAEEQIEEYVPVPIQVAGKGEVYLLYASGESMIEAGIDNGDMVLVQRQEEAREGDIVVAYVEGEGCTLKRLIYGKDGPVLHPENRTMTDIPAKECRIQGVAKWVFKKVG